MDAPSDGSSHPHVSLRPLLRALRPTHWPRNLLVFGPPVAAGETLLGTLGLRELLMAVCLVAMASAGYLVNDLHDLAEDRLHPRKRLRPLAGGTVSRRTALITAGVLTVAAVVLAVPLGIAGVGIVVLYGLTTAAYTFVFRGLPVLDVAVIAVCYLLRTAAGGVVAEVPLSSPFIAVTTLVAIFVTVGKRYSELVRASSGDGRTVLAGHRPVPLRVIAVVSAAAAVVWYAGWALGRGRGVLDTVAFVASAAAFALVLLRYAAAIRSHRAESPEAVVRRDRVLQVFAGGWAVTVGLGVLLR